MNSLLLSRKLFRGLPGRFASVQVMFNGVLRRTTGIRSLLLCAAPHISSARTAKTLYAC